MTRRIDRVHELLNRHASAIEQGEREIAAGKVTRLAEIHETSDGELRDVLGLPAGLGLDFSSSRIRIDEEGQAVQRCPRCGEDRTPSLVGIEAHDLTCRGLQR